MFWWLKVELYIKAFVVVTPYGVTIRAAGRACMMVRTERPGKQAPSGREML